MMSDTNILLVEDDQNLGNILKEYLEMKGFNILLARDGEAGFKAAKEQDYDLMILDVMLPKKDGFTLAKEIREKLACPAPIIFLTAKGEKNDKLAGFSAGADDYLTKPFSMEELLARIKAILRRTKGNTTPASTMPNFTFGNFEFDCNYQLLKNKDEEHKLSTKESELLKMLLQHQNQVLPRDKALKTIWHDSDYFTARSMDVYITKLRKYLKSDPRVQIINVHGKGYRLLVDA